MKVQSPRRNEESCVTHTGTGSESVICQILTVLSLKNSSPRPDHDQHVDKNAPLQTEEGHVATDRHFFADVIGGIPGHIL